MRSMAGVRDTEMSAGIFEEDQRCQGQGQTPRGSVHHFRISLWAEHLARVEPEFRQPSSLACVRRVNELAEVRSRIPLF